WRAWTVAALVAATTSTAAGQIPVASRAGQAVSEAPPVTVTYDGDDGLTLRSRDDRFMLQLGGRVQLRYSDPFDDDPVDLEDLAQARERDIDVRRARFRASGHLLTPKLTFAYQYDLVNTWLLDARLNYEVAPWLQVQAGPWKPEDHRARVAAASRPPPGGRT